MYIDAHCDTASVMLDKRKTLENNKLHFDLAKVPKDYTQIFAVYVDVKRHKKPMTRVKSVINKLKKEIDKQPDKIALCLDNDMRAEALKQGKTAAFISLEGCDAITKVEDVQTLYDMGVRIASLTWNNKNQLAGGVDSKDELTLLGRKVIQEFSKIGIVVDVSHLNEESFWEVMRVVNWPMIASHSCSKSVFKHKRNLTDEQFSAIASRGGVVGINFYPLFLNGRRKAYIKNIIKHIDHFLALGGENNIGLGSDFDGVAYLPQDLAGVEGMEALKAAFKEHGYSDELIDKICYGNFERILRLL